MEFFEKFKESFFSIIPIVIIVLLLSFFVIDMDREIIIRFLIGATFSIVGLAIFLRGVDIGVIPMGEKIGIAITKRKNLSLVLVLGFVIGTMITVAEPDVQVLASQIFQASNGIIAKNLLIISVAVGVGFFVSMALLRIVVQFSLRKALLIGYTAVFITAVFTSQDFLPLAFDSGGVTTGAMTVPFLLSLGMGVSSIRAGDTAEADNFGIVSLASIGPILACLILGVIYK